MIEKIIEFVNQKRFKNKDAVTLFIIAIVYDLNPALVLVSDKDIQSMSKEGIIYKNDKGKLLLNDSLLSELMNSSANEIVDRLDEYRNIFDGLFTGSKGSKKAIMDKLKRWLRENPDYTFDDVLIAANYWVQNKKKELKDHHIIGQADYFIYKVQDGVETSRLSSVIDDALEYSSGDSSFSYEQML